MASTIKVDNVQNQPGTNIVSKCGTDVTLGASGDTVALACGASQTGFGRTGTVDWVTTPKVTGDSPVTAATGSGYFLNTTAGTITINLPAGAAGSIVSIMDYAGTWDTNAVTVSPDGSEKIGGVNADVTLNTEGQSVTLVYVDSTQGWLNTMDSTSNVKGNAYMIATGGSITCCGNCKVHTFTGPGTFTVCTAAVCAANNLVSYMVVAGGGGGGGHGGGGAGAGGFRELKSPSTPYTASPLDGYPSAPNRITVTATGYPIVVGSGAAGGCNQPGTKGNDSTFSTITSTGGGFGGGGAPSPSMVGGPGGSGGGGGGNPPSQAGGTGNTPSQTPAQGTDGGTGNFPHYQAGGGGGATVVGTAGVPGPGGPAGPGGAGATTEISFSPTIYAGGGGGSSQSPGGSKCGTGGPGGGGAGLQPPGPPGNGTVNTGGGGGGVHNGPPACGGTGGSGIVIIRYKFQ